MRSMPVILMIMNRFDASQATREPEAAPTAIISVTDCGSEKNRFSPAKWLVDTLELQFDDVTVGPNCITCAHAEEIADFVLQYRKKAERFIVHCEYGQSRSAGIAAAIRQYIEGDTGNIFYSRRYAPNMTCYNLVLKALQQRGKKPRFLRK